MTQPIVKLDNEDQASYPTCPHCQAQLSELTMTVGHAQVSPLVSLVIDTFSCPACGTVLSVSGRK